MQQTNLYVSQEMAEQKVEKWDKFHLPHASQPYCPPYLTTMLAPPCVRSMLPPCVTSIRHNNATPCVTTKGYLHIYHTITTRTAQKQKTHTQHVLVRPISLWWLKRLRIRQPFSARGFCGRRVVDDDVLITLKYLSIGQQPASLRPCRSVRLIGIS